VTEASKVTDDLCHLGVVFDPNSREPADTFRTTDDDRGKPYTFELGNPGVVQTQVDHQDAVDSPFGPPALVDGDLGVDVRYHVQHEAGRT
jgi:hypothetical protein